MEESVFYVAQGDPSDKHSQDSFALAASIHSNQQFASFRQCDAPLRGAALTGVGHGERLFTCSNSKALIQVYLWGKESPDQRIPVPEHLSCLALCQQPAVGASGAATNNLPAFRVPWLLAAGSKTGKLYIWELASGNLLCVKDAHYQPISVIKFSSCGTFVVTGGEDSRVSVWRTSDLISVYTHTEDDNRLASVRPYATFTDHSLAVSDLILSHTGILPDLRMYTVSRDATLRCYDVASKQLLTTFVLPAPIECVAMDPASRALYVGLSNGLIRTVPLYNVNKHTSILESVGGCERIVTLDHDPELAHTFTHHQLLQAGADTRVTSLAISFDGTNLVSGDSAGKVLVSDVISKEVVHAFKECNSPISYIQVDTCPRETVVSTSSAAATANASKVDKHHRLIPPFKRVLASSNTLEHTLYVEIPAGESAFLSGAASGDFPAWLKQKELEELQFQNVTQINSTVKIVDSHSAGSAAADKVKDLEEKLARVSSAYTELRGKHEDLVNEHQKLL